MTALRKRVALAILALVPIGPLASCTPPRSSPPTVTPSVPSGVVDTGLTTGLRALRFVPGRFEYALTQSSTVEAPSTTDAPRSTILTTARLVVEVSAGGDSAYEVTVSIDSLQITTDGPIPVRTIAHPTSLGSVLRASVGIEETKVESSLPDSLCAYGQLVTLARDVLLPQLPTSMVQALSPVQEDTTQITACRAGSRIEMIVTRQITDLQMDPPQAGLHGLTELRGAGTLGRDSVLISGSVTTRGTALLAGNSRLPSLLQTQSEGRITVRLGDSTTVFRQSSTQRIEEKAPPDKEP